MNDNKDNAGQGLMHADGYATKIVLLTKVVLITIRLKLFLGFIIIIIIVIFTMRDDREDTG